MGSREFKNGFRLIIVFAEKRALHPLKLPCVVLLARKIMIMY